MIKKIKDIGESCSNIEITAIIDQEIVRHAERLLDCSPEDKLKAINEIETFKNVIRFAQTYLAGNWILTKKNFIIHKPPVPGLKQMHATLEITLINAIHIEKLRRAVLIERNGTTQAGIGVEINFSHHSPEYIKYGAGRYFLRDATIDRMPSIGEEAKGPSINDKIDEILKRP